MRFREHDDGGNLTERISHWASLSGADSPLYRGFALTTADDPVVLGILGESPDSMPVPLNLFAAVHYLLAQGADQDLAAHYPSLDSGRVPVGDPNPLFREFCATHAERLTDLVATRGVQTNEVRRCTSLLPAFATVAAAVHDPLWLIQLGPSAGLNLNFDRYHYDYGVHGSTGPEDSPVALTTDVRSGSPPVPDPLPEVAGRIGVDLAPVDLTDPDAVAWQRALIWPEQTERLTRLEAAIGIALDNPPPVVAGDAVEALPDLLDAVPIGAAPLVLNSFALYQVPESGRDRIHETLREHSRRRQIHRVSLEMIGTPTAVLTHTHYARGAARATNLAEAHFHGRWLDWKSA